MQCHAAHDHRQVGKKQLIGPMPSIGLQCRIRESGVSFLSGFENPGTGAPGCWLLISTVVWFEFQEGVHDDNHLVELRR